MFNAISEGELVLCYLIKIVIFSSVIAPQAAYLDEAINKGNHITPIKTLQPPTVEWEPVNAPDPTYYTLMLVRLKPPIDPFNAEGNIILWMVCDIQGSDISTGNVLVNYVPPYNFRSPLSYSLYSTILATQQYENISSNLTVTQTTE